MTVIKNASWQISLCFLSLHSLNDFGKGLWSSKALFFMNLSFQKLCHELYTALPHSWIALDFGLCSGSLLRWHSLLNWSYQLELWDLMLISQLQNECTGLRNGSHVPKNGFAAVSQLRNEGNCAAKWHSCVKKWFRSCETPFQMASRLRNSSSSLHARLQMTINYSFHLQIIYRLKHWTPDFPSFETRYDMHNLSSRKCFKNVSNSSEMELRNERMGLPNGTRVPKSGFAASKYPAKWSFGWEIGIFHVLELRSRFAAAKWGSLCCKMALVCQNVLRSCEIPYGMELWLRNWEFSRFGASQPFRSCKMGALVLRSGTRVAKLVS
uniref:Uncharacterized protein n=1 Tax=Vitis vinifera TaxID=29760 RepID=A5AXZ1_VITVI|nr:hypothetical protein VITISV_018080 [Vitis vinifera]